MSEETTALERRLGAIDSDMRSMQMDVNYLKAEMSRLGKETERITDTLSTVAATVARIDGAMPHMATQAEVEKASHSATRGTYTGLSAVAFSLVALLEVLAPVGLVGRRSRASSSVVRASAIAGSPMRRNWVRCACVRYQVSPGRYPIRKSRS